MGIGTLEYRPTVRSAVQCTTSVFNPQLIKNTPCQITNLLFHVSLSLHSLLLTTRILDLFNII